MILVGLAVGVILVWELLRKLFWRTSSVASLIATEAIVVAVVAAGFLRTPSATIRGAVFLLGAFFMLTMSFLWRDARIVKKGKAPVRTVFPTRVGKPARVLGGIVGVVSVAFYSAAVTRDPGSFSWTNLLEVALVVAATGYIALTSRVPAWTAKVFGAHQETASESGTRVS